ncbi:type IV pilin protein [Acaryochloris marina]|uniref:General secretion pathway protein n=1 Tax=Acaryochloris marina (strain MBIC 11017) TaxID=329726 RepID=B0C6G8_ACAM1|nr:type IV pilin-like G/H family protein [Acaryochloris marina]ABW26389.1 general secretion pathway protein [Acaryochloris marina MBIC11017]BDM81205.1 pili assembly chaperone [Acaryochloris marina MBIC10699]
MKTNLQAKLIQHFANKKGNKGFTLIELLVVVIIIGILAAVALPSMLNQANRARQSAAQSQVGAVNRAQQAYRLEETQFAPAYADLQIADASTEDYTIAIATATATAGETSANPNDTGSGLQFYRGCVSVDAATGTTDSSIEEGAAAPACP